MHGDAAGKRDRVLMVVFSEREGGCKSIFVVVVWLCRRTRVWAGRLRENGVLICRILLWCGAHGMEWVSWIGGIPPYD